jgi:hypothetical protein
MRTRKAKVGGVMGNNGNSAGIKYVNNTRNKSKYTNMNKRISEYQNRLRSMLNSGSSASAVATNDKSVDMNIDDVSKTTITEVFEKSLDEIIGIMNSKLSQYNRYIIHCTYNMQNHFGGRSGHNIYTLSMYDCEGYFYVLKKWEKSIELGITINGPLNYEYRGSIQSIEQIQVPGNLTPYPLNSTIIDFARKYKIYGMLSSAHTHLINYIEATRK